jgi:hypothetical protein
MFETLTFLKENFGSPQNVLALFSFYGFNAPKLSAVEKWFQRGSVPGSYLILLLCIVEMERGEPVRISHYLQGGK